MRAPGHRLHVGDKHEYIYDLLSHPFDDEWQRRRSPFWELPSVDIPVFSIGVWDKAAPHLRGNFHGFERVQGPKKLLVTHPSSFAEAQRYYFDEQFHCDELLPWCDHHLKGVENGVMNQPAARFYVNGDGAYRSAESWPPPDVRPMTWLRASHRAEDPELTSDMRPFHQHAQVEPLVPGDVYELRVELLPMSFLAHRGDRIRLEISNQDSLITDAPMTHFYGTKAGTDTYHHDRSHPSTLRLHERPRT